MSKTISRPDAATGTTATKQERTEFFNCLQLTRDDFKEVGFDAETLTDIKMENFARKVGESCMEQFWASLEYFAEYYGLPKTE
jgi:hypothetical protein